MRQTDSEQHFNVMEDLLHFFAYTAKRTFEDMVIYMLCQKRFCSMSGEIITAADVTVLTPVYGTTFFYMEQHRYMPTLLLICRIKLYARNTADLADYEVNNVGLLEKTTTIKQVYTCV